MTARYRRRAEEVEAIQFDGTNAEECFGLGAPGHNLQVGWWAVKFPDGGASRMRDAEFRAAFEPVPSPGAPTERERRLARGIEHLAYVGILKADDHDVYAQLLDEARAVLASPATESPTNYPCSDCGAPRTKEQGGTTFTVCDECWDRHYKKPSPATESAEPGYVTHEATGEYIGSSMHRVVIVAPGGKVDRLHSRYDSEAVVRVARDWAAALGLSFREGA